MTPNPTEPRLAADAHDTIRLLALGGLALGRRFEANVVAPHSGADTLPADHPVVLASLGVIALRRALERWLSEAASAETPPAASVADVLTGDLLR